MNLNLNSLSDKIQQTILDDKNSKWINPYACKNENAYRRFDIERDRGNIWRPAFVRDIEKILHLPTYNRYSDKTQVFSLYSNDDITRRALHVQIVSRIARNIGSVLGLNVDLIEAIALGHDLGHTPFGHAGEKFLNEILNECSSKHFNHNVQSARVLDFIYRRNLTIQTLDGVLCHDGEREKQIYIPENHLDFEKFDDTVFKCRNLGVNCGVSLNPSTLEGCVVRVSDMIAYLGKDRQDAVKANIISDDNNFTSNILGKNNADIINNLIVDIIENSYRKNYISFSESAFDALRTIKDENYTLIYKNKSLNEMLNDNIKPMFEKVYKKLIFDLENRNFESVIFKHHINYIVENTRFYNSDDYTNQDSCDIVSDFIASMTDDYFICLFEYLFPSDTHGLKYKSYFN